MMLTVTLNLRNTADNMNHILQLELMSTVLLLHNVKHKYYILSYYLHWVFKFSNGFVRLNNFKNCSVTILITMELHKYFTL
jgi:hypothetical protein